MDLIYEKVTYVEPFTHRRRPQGRPRSGRRRPFVYCAKQLHLRLTEDQVRELLDHPDSTYLRVMGMLYVRCGTPAPASQVFIRNFPQAGGDPGLWNGSASTATTSRSSPRHPADAHDDGGRPRGACSPWRSWTHARIALPPVGPILEYRFSVHLAAPTTSRSARRWCRAPLGGRGVGLSPCARDFYGEDDGEEDAIVGAPTGSSRRSRRPSASAPEGTLQRFKIKFSDGVTAMAKLGMSLPPRRPKKRSLRRRRGRRRRAAASATARRRGPLAVPRPRPLATAAAGPLPRPFAPRAGPRPPPRARSRSRAEGAHRRPCAAPPRSRSPRRFRPPSRDRAATIAQRGRRRRVAAVRRRDGATPAARRLRRLGAARNRRRDDGAAVHRPPVAAAMAPDGSPPRRSPPSRCRRHRAGPGARRATAPRRGGHRREASTRFVLCALQEVAAA